MKMPSMRAAFTMCFLGMLFYCYEYYLRVAPSVMKIELQHSFHLTETAFGYLVAFYYYAYTLMQIPVGLSIDKFGPRRVLTFACAICALGTYCFATTTLTPVAQLARFMIGFGSAFAYVGVLKLTNDWLPAKYFAPVTGLCNTLGMLGAIFGEVSMEYLVNVIGWQQTLHYAVIAGVILMLTLWFVLKDKGAQKVQVTDEPLKLSAILKALLMLSRNRQMWIIGLIGCFTFLPISGFAEVWAPNYLENVGLTQSQAAWGSSLVFLGFAFGAPLWGAISERIKSRRIPMIMGALAAAASMLYVLWIPSENVAVIYMMLFLTGFFTSVEIIIFAVGNDISDSRASATAAAFSNMVITIAGALLAPVVGLILDNSLRSSGDVIPSITHYSGALTIIPISLIAASLLALILKESHPASASIKNARTAKEAVLT
ncbi:MAG: MFS transporter [Candidatus Berkiella sp.]